MLPLGLAFGALVVRSGLDWWWAGLSAALIYGGSFEFLLIGMVTAVAPPASIAVAAFLVQARHVFYALSFPLHRVRGRLAKTYSTFALTDEAYALTMRAAPGTRTSSASARSPAPSDTPRSSPSGRSPTRSPSPGQMHRHAADQPSRLRLVVARADAEDVSAGDHGRVGDTVLFQVDPVGVQIDTVPRLRDLGRRAPASQPGIAPPGNDARRVGPRGLRVGRHPSDGDGEDVVHGSGLAGEAAHARVGQSGAQHGTARCHGQFDVVPAQFRQEPGPDEPAGVRPVPPPRSPERGGPLLVHGAVAGPQSGVAGAVPLLAADDDQLSAQADERPGHRPGDAGASPARGIRQAARTRSLKTRVPDGPAKVPAIPAVGVRFGGEHVTGRFVVAHEALGARPQGLPGVRPYRVQGA
ncbi:AzlC family ABC transporter permease [Streptomyces viridochromogenes]|uniref:AzlC family ABC transporter permease n=1 Tax=Streptomyces viridochromogenes TaxID=1938 RepID=UPI0023EA5468|nr:AzlC family ABC transporter permease [Streptomyces viridochromogenes]